MSRAFLPFISHSFKFISTKDKIRDTEQMSKISLLKAASVDSIALNQGIQEIPLRKPHYLGQRIKSALRLQLSVSSQIIEKCADDILIIESSRLFKIWYAGGVWCRIAGYNARDVVGCTLGIIQGEGTDPDEIRPMYSSIAHPKSHSSTLITYKKWLSAFCDIRSGRTPCRHTQRQA
jgi:hypothetical protein